MNVPDLKPKLSFDANDGNSCSKIHCPTGPELKQTGDSQSMKTREAASNSSRTKDDEHEFNLSFDEDFFNEIQKGIELDE